MMVGGGGGGCEGEVTGRAVAERTARAWGTSDVDGIRGTT